MLMVIFGAGASYDSYAGEPAPRPGSRTGSRPPLAADLVSGDFGHFARKHEACLGLFPDLKRAVDPVSGPGLEVELERIVSSAPEYGNRVARQLLGMRLYIQDVIQTTTNDWWVRANGQTNYVELLNRVATWCDDNDETATFVSFNYDTLLDRACTAVWGHRLNTMDAYLAHPKFTVLKVHGSTNWRRLVVRPDERVASLDCAHNLEWTDDYRVLGEPADSQEGGADFVPAIAMPTVNKTAFECPGAHLERLRQAMDSVSHILVVGWRGMENHFLREWEVLLGQEGLPTLPRNLSKILVVDVSDDSAKNVLERLNAIGVRPAHGQTAATDGFSGFIKRGLLEEFLRMGPDLISWTSLGDTLEGDATQSTRRYRVSHIPAGWIGEVWRQNIIPGPNIPISDGTPYHPEVHSEGWYSLPVGALLTPDDAKASCEANERARLGEAVHP